MLASAGAAATLAWGLVRLRPALAFGSSATLLLGLLATAAAASWPVLLRSTLAPGLRRDGMERFGPGKHAAHGGVWASIGLPLAVAYFLHVARTFRDPPRAP